jgi:hypothetical protein
VTKARLFSLLILASCFSAYLGLAFKPWGFNDGGYW